MSQFLGAAPSERTEERKRDRSGYYARNLVTRIGKLEQRVPRDRNDEFSTPPFPINAENCSIAPKSVH